MSRSKHLTIWLTGLSASGKTTLSEALKRILTDKGYFNIKSLAEQKINVWNGIEFSEVTVKKTSDSSRLYKVLLDNGMELDCTDEHKWLVRSGNQTHPERCKIEKIFTKKIL